jgi:hypothetical protein
MITNRFNVKEFCTYPWKYICGFSVILTINIYLFLAHNNRLGSAMESLYFLRGVADFLNI